MRWFSRWRWHCQTWWPWVQFLNPYGGRREWFLQVVVWLSHLCPGMIPPSDKQTNTEVNKWTKMETPVTVILKGILIVAGAGSWVLPDKRSFRNNLVCPWEVLSSQWAGKKAILTFIAAKMWDPLGAALLCWRRVQVRAPVLTTSSSGFLLPQREVPHGCRLPLAASFLPSPWEVCSTVPG